MPLARTETMKGRGGGGGMNGWVNEGEKMLGCVLQLLARPIKILYIVVQR